MRNIWKCAPMLRLTIPFLMGMVVPDVYHDTPNAPWVAVLMALAIIGVGFKAYRLWFNQRHWLGLGLFLLFFALGWMRSMAFFDSFPRQVQPMAESSWLAVVLEQPVERENSFKCIVQVRAVVADSIVLDSTLHVLLYMAKCEAVKHLDRDDFIVLTGKVQTIETPIAPGEFNLQQHYKRRNIFCQVYADSLHWHKVGSIQSHDWGYCLDQWRRFALNKLKDYHIVDREYGVLAALILGDTSDMDKELMASYSAAGVIHVLAVSGLHVGLVYVLLAPFFKWIFGKSKGKWIRTILPIIILWLYSLLSGGSPSVLRAAVMFSCFVFADNFGKNSNIFNTMASSAFVLCLIRPSMLFELGFQLSYLAVIGIVVLQKPIYLLCHFSNKILDKLWTMTAVSIAAQLVTLPLTLYYFHQFPNYFLASNLFIIPWSTLLIYVSILFYCCLPFPPLALFLSKVMLFMTQCMNHVIVWFDRLPGSVTTQIPCNAFDFFCWSFALFFGLRWLFWKRKLALVMLLTVLCCAVIGYVVQLNQRFNQSEVMLHCGKKSWFLSSAVADSIALFAPDSLAMRQASYGFKNYLRDIGVVQPKDTLMLDLRDDPILWTNETALYLADSLHLTRYGLNQAHIVFLFDVGRLRLDKKQWSALRHCQLVIGPTISKRKAAWLAKHLDPSVEVLRMRKGAYKLKNRRFVPYVE